MRHYIATLLGFLLAMPASFAASGNVVAAANVHAQLESEVNRVGPGQSFWVALVLDIGDGWHTYWRNPGDSGQATQIDWTLPPGFRAGPIEWPAPHRFVLAPLVNFGYAKQAVHLVKITAPAAVEPGAPITLRARARWLVCSNICIPENAALELTLPATARPGAVDPAAAPLFARARAQLPQKPPAPATAALGDGRLRITLGPEWGASLSDVTALSFVPYDDGVIAYAAPQVMTRSGGSVHLSMKLGDSPPKGGAIGGVLFVTTAGHGAAPLTIPLAIEATAPATAAAATVATTATATTATTAATAAVAPAPAHHQALGVLLALALIGGMVLNLMPCVLPVLSIKALGFVEQARRHPHEVRMKGLAFAAGVIASMLALAAALLLLRAGGEQIGWGFQLQSPLFVTLMAYMLLLVGLNLSGVFEIGGGFTGVGEGLTHGDNRRASFFTGVLTTLVATPCTAPFMAAAVGAALTQSPVIALAIFGTLGLGLALPILLLSYAPWLQRLLPKPGAWMATLKQLFAFPMYASAAWLLWVLAQQTSAIGLGAALAGLVLVALAAWAYQKFKTGSGRLGKLAAAATAVAALIVAVWLPTNLEGAPRTDTAATVNDTGWQPYDPARIAKLRAAGRPILIDFTASWCLTCLVNERNTFSEAAVRAVFRDKNVALFKGDWTRQDPRITQALSHFGRAGVPLYVVYNGVPGSTKAVVLPQVLTASIVEGAFAALPGGTPH